MFTYHVDSRMVFDPAKQVVRSWANQRLRIGLPNLCHLCRVSHLLQGQRDFLPCRQNHRSLYMQQTESASWLVDLDSWHLPARWHQHRCSFLHLQDATALQDPIIIKVIPIVNFLHT